MPDAWWCVCQVGGGDMLCVAVSVSCELGLYDKCDGYDRRRAP